MFCFPSLDYFATANWTVAVLEMELGLPQNMPYTKTIFLLVSTDYKNNW